MANRLHSKVVKGGAKKQKPVPVKIVGDRPDYPSMKTDRKYEAQDALRTLQRAEEIKRDRGLMKIVKSEAKAQVKALSNVCK